MTRSRVWRSSIRARAGWSTYGSSAGWAWKRRPKRSRYLRALSSANGVWRAIGFIVNSARTKRADAMTPEARIIFFRAWRFLAAIYALANKGGMTAAALLRSVGKVDFRLVIYGLCYGE